MKSLFYEIVSGVLKKKTQLLFKENNVGMFLNCNSIQMEWRNILENIGDFVIN